MVDLAPQAATQVQASAVPSARRYYVLAILTIVAPVLMGGAVHPRRHQASDLEVPGFK
jgi:hypothetical protein